MDKKCLLNIKVTAQPGSWPASCPTSSCSPRRSTGSQGGGRGTDPRPPVKEISISISYLHEGSGEYVEPNGLSSLFGHRLQQTDI